MSNPQVRIYTENGIYIDREMTESEFAQYEKDLAETLKRKEDELAQAEAKTALLEKLGITEEEAKLLLS